MKRVFTIVLTIAMALTLLTGVGALAAGEFPGGSGFPGGGNSLTAVTYKLGSGDFVIEEFAGDAIDNIVFEVQGASSVKAEIGTDFSMNAEGKPVVTAAFMESVGVGSYNLWLKNGDSNVTMMMGFAIEEGDEPAGEEPAGEEPAGEEPAGEEPAGEEPAGEEPAGEEPAGEEPAGEEPAELDPTVADAFSYNAETGKIEGKYESDGDIEIWVDGKMAGASKLAFVPDHGDGKYVISVYENGKKIAEFDVSVCSNHNFVLKASKAATCTEKGSNEYECSVCGAKKTEEVAMIAHTPVVDPAVAPEVGKTGLTEGSHCSVCGAVITAQIVIPALEEPDPIENKYEITLDGTTTGSDTTSGSGTVVLKEGNQPIPALYARVTWVYAFDNGDTFAYCAMKEVRVAEDGSMSYKMNGPTAPASITLTAVQVALVTDPDADASGAYDALSTAKLDVGSAS